MMNLPVFNDNGVKRVLACLPTPDNVKRKFAPFQSVHSPIPRSDWVDVDLRTRGLKATVRDQGAHGSCVGHGSATAFTYAWLAGGGAWHEFSPCWIYGNINGGVDQGANVGDALQLIKTAGVALEADVPEGMIYSRQFPAQAAVDAKRFKVGDAMVCHTFDDIGTAVQLGQPGAFGIDVYTNFTPDAQGVIPPPAGQIEGGHCMCFLGMKLFGGRSKSTFVPGVDPSQVGEAQIGGKWYLVDQNSWTTQWGLGGFAWLGEEHFQRDASDNWSLPIGGAIDDPNATNNPPEPA